MFREYADAIGEDFWRRGFEEELAALRGYYDALLIARGDAGELAGCVEVKRLPDGTAELKRLYVRLPWRGTGLGRTLATAAVERARELGYSMLRLDTLAAMEAARAPTSRSDSSRPSVSATTRSPAISSSSCGSSR